MAVHCSIIILFMSFCYMEGFAFVQTLQSTKHSSLFGDRSHSKLQSTSHDLIIWDCDGVLVDSEALLKQGEVEGLARAGIEMSTDDCVRLFSGVSTDEAALNFLNEMKRELPEGFFKEQISGSLQLFRERLIPLMSDTVLHLKSNYPGQMCVASGSPLNRVLLCLELAKIDGCFNANTVFTRELVKRGKPAPDLFLHAAEKMNINEDRCIVVEDSVAGIEAALAANMRVIGFLGGGKYQ
jgi:beta-phosphoglucomutase-like phosphatase (HAD superfamily)